MLLNLRLAWRLLPITFWRRLIIPMLITFEFETTLTGVGAIRSQRHHVSHAGFLWLGQNPLLDWVATKVWAPYSGPLLSRSLGLVEGTAGR